MAKFMTLSREEYDRLTQENLNLKTTKYELQEREKMIMSELQGVKKLTASQDKEVSKLQKEIEKLNVKLKKGKDKNAISDLSDEIELLKKQLEEMHELQASTHAAARAAETTPTNPPAEASTNALDMAKIEETRREMEVLKKDLQQLRQESAAANDALAKSMAREGEVVAARDRLSYSILELQQQLKDATSTIEVLRADLIEAKDELAMSHHKLSTLQSQVASSSKLAAPSEPGQALIDLTDVAISGESTEIQDSVSTEELATLKEEVRLLSGQVQHLKADNAKLKDKLAASEDAVARTSADKAAAVLQAQEETKAARAAEEITKQSVEHLRRELEISTSALEAMRSELAGVKDEQAKVVSQQSSSQTHIDILTISLAEKEAQCAVLTSKVTQLTADLEVKERALGSATDQLVAAERSSREARDDFKKQLLTIEAGANETTKKYASEVDSLKAEILSLETKMKADETSLRKKEELLVKQNSDLVTELKQTQDDLEATKKKVEAVVGERAVAIEAAEAEKQKALSAAATDKEKVINVLRTEIDSLKTKCTQLEIDLMREQTRLKELQLVNEELVKDQKSLPDLEAKLRTELSDQYEHQMMSIKDAHADETAALTKRVQELGIVEKRQLQLIKELKQEVKRLGSNAAAAAPEAEEERKTSSQAAQNDLQRKIEALEKSVEALTAEVEHKEAVIKEIIRKGHTTVTRSEAEELAKGGEAVKDSESHGANLAANVMSLMKFGGPKKVDKQKEMESVMEDVLVKNLDLQKALETMGKELERYHAENMKLRQRLGEEI